MKEAIDPNEVSVPLIRDYMRTAPYTIGADIFLKDAAREMEKHDIRHLPVLFSGELVGILSQRDLSLAMALGDSSQRRVAEIMTEPVFTVAPDVPLADVVERMARSKYGAVVIAEDDTSVIGIFTAIDALHLLNEELRYGKLP